MDNAGQMYGTTVSRASCNTNAHYQNCSTLGPLKNVVYENLHCEEKCTAEYEDIDCQGTITAVEGPSAKHEANSSITNGVTKPVHPYIEMLPDEPCISPYAMLPVESFFSIIAGSATSTDEDAFVNNRGYDKFKVGPHSFPSLHPVIEEAAKDTEAMHYVIDNPAYSTLSDSDTTDCITVMKDEHQNKPDHSTNTEEHCNTFVEHDHNEEECSDTIGDLIVRNQGSDMVICDSDESDDTASYMEMDIN